MICRIKGRRNKTDFIIMKPISDKEENYINKHNRYFIEDKSKHVNNILLYGEVDFNNQEDISLINKFNFIEENGNIIYSNFNFDNGTITTIDNLIKMYQTFNNILWFKFCYCLIGKPNKIVIYKVSNKHDI